MDLVYFVDRSLGKELADELQRIASSAGVSLEVMTYLPH
jgi:hypothetical protein